MNATRYAVRGTVNTPEGRKVRTYNSADGTRTEATGLLTDLRIVQADGKLPKDARIVALDEDGNVVESVPTALHIEGAPSLKGGILAAAFATSSPKLSRFLTVLGLTDRPAA